MKNRKVHSILNILIALVWLINGLFCKILNLVPRHEHIVRKITNSNYSHQLTILIGVFEVLMVFWILSQFKPKLNAVFQIVIVAVMNILEYLIAPEFLLWGKFNSLFALTFILIIYYNNFHLNKQNQIYVTMS